MDINNLTEKTNGLVFSKEFAFCEQMLNIATSNIINIEECIKAVLEYVPTDEIKKSFIKAVRENIDDVFREVNNG